VDSLPRRGLLGANVNPTLSGGASALDGIPVLSKEAANGIHHRVFVQHVWGWIHGTVCQNQNGDSIHEVMIWPSGVEGENRPSASIVSVVRCLREGLKMARKKSKIAFSECDQAQCNAS
jgi:hypothetical protein